jgi:anti-sigma regulatory factor (Ser/Thr protein kinase)
VLESAGAAGVEFVSTALLLTSELVTNAVLHADTGDVLLVIDLDATRLLVKVIDGDRSVPERRIADPSDDTGRGLALLDELASSWGTVPEGAGKAVWFVLVR